MRKIILVSEVFSAAHFYHQPAWSEEKNRAEFGKCFTKYGHGHNYKLEVGFQDTGLDLSALQSAVKSVTDLLDHQHLNFVIPEFKTQIPTTENIAIYIVSNLQKSHPTAKIDYVKLFEMDNLWVEIRN